MPEQHLDWDGCWMSVAEVVALRSRCDLAQIGSVVVDRDNRIRSTGYNGPPAGLWTEGGCLNYCQRAITGERPRDYDNCVTVHAEMNALLFCDRDVVRRGTLYCSAGVCIACAKAIGNFGLRRVVMVVDATDKHRFPEQVCNFLDECGLEVSVWPRDWRTLH